jgi:hypothetical protein
MQPTISRVMVLFVAFIFFILLVFPGLCLPGLEPPIAA